MRWRRCSTSTTAARPGEWLPNAHGGHENLEAVQFLRTVNLAVNRQHPDVQTIAEESTAWPRVSRPVTAGGLGFGMKWDMGWMHDALAYFAVDPLFRRGHHGKLTFRGLYLDSENFVLPLSHDEVVYGKRSLLEKMPGDDWQKFATLRLLYAFQWAQPGKKLLFMGGEFGQRREWNHDRSLDWHLLRESPRHGQLQLLVGELNRLYRTEPSLHQKDFDPRVRVGGGRRCREQRLRVPAARAISPAILAVFNATPIPRFNYRIGVPRDGMWTELLDSDSAAFGGSDHGNNGGVEAAPVPSHGRPLLGQPHAAAFGRALPQALELEQDRVRTAPDPPKPCGPILDDHESTARRASSSACNRSAILNGFRRKTFQLDGAPLGCGIMAALINTMGKVLVHSRARTRLQNSSPFIVGIMKSTMTQLGRSDSRIRRPSDPFGAVSTARPSQANISDSDSTNANSSSMTRTLFPSKRSTPLFSLSVSRHYLWSRKDLLGVPCRRR